MNVHSSRYLPTYRCYWRRSGVFIVNFQHISHLCSSVSNINFERVIAGWYNRFRNISHDLWTNCAASSNFPTSVARSKFVVQLESREGGGGAVTLPSGDPGLKLIFRTEASFVSPWIAQNRKSTLWDQFMNGHLSVFRWISFYTFENWGSEFEIQN